MAFVHLHVHSQLSLLDGTADPEDIGRAAARLGFQAIALTDTNNLFGAVAFYKSCKANKVRPILGAELHVQPEGVAHKDPRGLDGGFQIVALVEDEVGYRNLCWLVTEAIFHGIHYKPRVDLEQLAARRDGLVFLTGGLRGCGAEAMSAGRHDDALAEIQRLCAAVGQERLYLELVDVGVPGQELINEGVRAAAGDLGLPTVVTNAVHYLEAEHAPTYEVLHAIAAGATLNDGAVAARCPTDQAYLKSEAEMRELFPHDGDAIDRTVAVAARCAFSFTFGAYHFPATTPPDVAPDGTQPDTEANWAYFYQAFPPPRDFPTDRGGRPERPEGGGNLGGYFRWYARTGLRLRLQRIEPERHAAYWERLESELTMIIQMGFPAYLLIVAEFINWSKDEGIPVGPGRGSAAGSLVAWAMRITDIDPIRFELLFERFLNPARVSMPDIDVDFCQDRREEVITHVREKYGAPLVSQIVTYGKLKAKAAVRDVARVLGLSFVEADRLAKLVPETLGITLREALAEVDQLRALREGDPKIRRVIDLALGVEGIVRQTGVHAAGVVIADRPLVEYAPLYCDEPGGGPVVQYDMKSAELIGLIKFDFLGLKTLDQIRDAIAAIHELHGVVVDASAIPVDDAAAYELLQRGDTLGVFQLESSGMRELLGRLKPTVLDDLVALVALYRPGPLSAGMVDDFVDRKHGRKEVSYPLPQLEPILANTYGTIVYQEQVMQVAQVMAGYSLGEADLLRRAMGKKKKEEMDQQKERFLSGSVQNGIDVRKADDIFELLAKFAAYGFNKSHSAAYGYISYQTAWLKAHYRPEFMAALMTSEAANSDKVIAYLHDGKAHGIQIAPVCVNRSRKAFSAEHRDGARFIRVGLCGVKNVGDTSIDAILEARVAGGPFTSAFNFFERLDHKRMNRRVFENLIRAGALDVFGESRAALMASLDAVIGAALRVQEEKAAGQASLFAALPQSGPAFRFPDLPELPLSERLQGEKETLGLYLTGHPMTVHRSDVKRFATSTITALDRVEPDTEVRVAGLAADVRVVKTKRGDKMAFVRLEDEQGVVEAVFFADAWSRSQRVLEAGGAVLVTGQVEQRDGEAKLRASGVESLEEVRGRSTRSVAFALRIEELAGNRLPRFRALLDELRGSCAARVDVRVDDVVAELKLPFPVDPSSVLEERVSALFGRSDVVVLS
jgi:DNA polymerase-3 subunit alpha